MRQPINFDQNELDELANQADDLQNWLKEPGNMDSAKKTLRIPPYLTIIMTTTYLYGLKIYLDGIIPNVACWLGDCTVG